MLHSAVFVYTQPRRAQRVSSSFAPPFLSRIPAPQPLSSKSNAIISFTDPHPLNSAPSHRYKNIGPTPTPEARHSGLIARRCNQILFFHTLAHSFAVSCIFLLSRKTQVFFFQPVPHSLQKTSGCGGILPFLELIPLPDQSYPRSFFSCTCRDPILQTLYFEIHAGMGGVHPFLACSARLRVLNDSALSFSSSGSFTFNFQMSTSLHLLASLHPCLITSILFP